MEVVNTDVEGECIGEFVRVRVSIDITKPLKKILKLKLENNKTANASSL